MRCANCRKGRGVAQKREFLSLGIANLCGQAIFCDGYFSSRMAGGDCDRIDNFPERQFMGTQKGIICYCGVGCEQDQNRLVGLSFRDQRVVVSGG